MRGILTGLALTLVVLPVSANALDGIYVVSVSDNAMFLVDSATIAPVVQGRRSAIVYVLDKFGADDGRYTESIDCKNHRARKVSGVGFIVSSENDDILLGNSGPLADTDNDNEGGSTMQEVEVFVCQWPNSAAGQKPLEDLPKDERALMLTLGTSAKRALSK